MDDIITRAKDLLKSDQDYWREIYKKAKEDAKFLSDDDFAQWEEQDYNNRVQSGRPALTIDQLSQFVHQVANDIRINTPTINVIPVGLDSSQETAETIKGLIKSIEYGSNADNAYDTAVYNAIKQGIGFIRVDHDYVDENSFDQEIKIERVTNPLSCWLDGSSIQIDGRDAKHATILEQIRISDFKRLYPGKTPRCFQADETQKTNGDDDYIFIAEHFCIKETEKTIGINDRGEIFEVTGKQKPKRTRIVKERTVMRYKLSGEDVLEETVFPGKFIPIIPVYGEENWIDGKRHIFSLIRKSKGAQKMFNYWKSLETELLMKSPIAPVMAAEGQVEDYAADWLNPSKAGVLRYKTQDAQGNPVGAPQRLEPPLIPSGIINASRGAVDDIKATMGIYNASLGIKSNEQSGVAIAQRKQEGDVATYHFSDNLSKAITQVGRVIIGMIKDVYDTARILRIIGAEDEPKQIGVNGEMAEDQEETIDLTKGNYDVRVVTGASYTTLRQESVAALQSVFSSSPELMNVMGDLYFKYSDFAGAQAMASRMKKVVDPKFLEEEDRQELQQDIIDPEKMQMAQMLEQGQAQIQAMQQELQTMQEALDDKRLDAELKMRADENKQQQEEAKNQIALLELQVQQKAAEMEIKIKMEEIELKKAEMALKQEQMQNDLAQRRMEAKLQAPPDVALTDADMNEGTPPILVAMSELAQSIKSGLETVAISQAQGNQAVLEALTKPKQVVRDNAGKIAGVV